MIHLHLAKDCDQPSHQMGATSRGPRKIRPLLGSREIVLCNQPSTFDGGSRVRTFGRREISWHLILALFTQNAIIMFSCRPNNRLHKARIDCIKSKQEGGKKKEKGWCQQWIRETSPNTSHLKKKRLQMGGKDGRARLQFPVTRLRLVCFGKTEPVGFRQRAEFWKSFLICLNGTGGVAALQRQLTNSLSLEFHYM